MFLLFGNHALRLRQLPLDGMQQTNPDILALFEEFNRKRYAEDAAQEQKQRNFTPFGRHILPRIRFPCFIMSPLRTGDLLKGLFVLRVLLSGRDLLV